MARAARWLGLLLCCVAGTSAVSLTTASSGLVYEPDVDFHGSDEITVTVRSAAGEFASAAVPVVIEAANDAPELAGVAAARDAAAALDVVAGGGARPAVDGATGAVDALEDAAVRLGGGLRSGIGADARRTPSPRVAAFSDADSTAASLDAPAVVDGFHGAREVDEDAPLALTGVSVVDADYDDAAVAAAPSLYCTLRVSARRGSVALAGGTWAAAAAGASLVDDDAGSLTLAGRPGELTAALASLVYTSAPDGDGGDVVDFSVDDGGAFLRRPKLRGAHGRARGADSRRVRQDAPRITAPATVRYAEAFRGVALGRNGTKRETPVAGVEFEDPDSDVLAVTVVAAGGGVRTVDRVPDVDYGDDLWSERGAVVRRATLRASPERLNAALSTLAWVGDDAAGDKDGLVAGAITITATDGDGLETTATIALEASAFNDAPVLSSDLRSAEFAEDSGWAALPAGGHVWRVTMSGATPGAASAPLVASVDNSSLLAAASRVARTANAVGGTLDLAVAGFCCASVAANASGADLQRALNALPSVAAVRASRSDAEDAQGGFTWSVTFLGLAPFLEANGTARAKTVDLAARSDRLTGEGAAAAATLVTARSGAPRSGASKSATAATAPSTRTSSNRVAWRVTFSDAPAPLLRVKAVEGNDDEDYDDLSLSDADAAREEAWAAANTTQTKVASLGNRANGAREPHGGARGARLPAAGDYFGVVAVDLAVADAAGATDHLGLTVTVAGANDGPRFDWYGAAVDVSGAGYRTYALDVDEDAEGGSWAWRCAADANPAKSTPSR
ncbi:hypothetical protein JL722_3365 [Aureococcus anophagefferens]|nr:hypothetical protein JL722_3365 [Aureococcus anophagefferens]